MTTEFFPGFSPQSKVWIYQADRPLSGADENKVREASEQFVNVWSAHGKSLKAGFVLLFSRFLIFAVDETQAMASGCSIDESLRFVQKLEKETGINFLNRMQVAYMKEGKVKTCNMHEISDLLKSGEITPETSFFNNLVNTKKDLEQLWVMPLKNSWHVKFAGV